GHVITPSSPARPGRWRLSASGGPVWASAGLDDFSKPSWRWGGQVSYRLGSVHALSLGAWYTKMYYEAGEGDYTPPKGFWTRRIAPTSTDATCKILEVPLIWQRAPRGYGRSGWQYEAGLVSYWLLAEYYHYDYDLTDDDLIRWWGAHGENHHLFAGGHLAIGHQWALGRHLGLGLQSFVQFPLGGIGHGKVHLYTAGIQLQMSFGRWR
ncbi:MAG: hypothetical protein KDC54_05905, partial [Lewinella sp.]|nr:hypothetical protein [Lewinella sp.]